MENNDRIVSINKIECNEEILREIWNRIMIEIWSIIPTSLAHGGIMTENVIMEYSYESIWTLS